MSNFFITIFHLGPIWVNLPLVYKSILLLKTLFSIEMVNVNVDLANADVILLEFIIL